MTRPLASEERMVPEKVSVAGSANTRMDPDFPIRPVWITVKETGQVPESQLSR